MVRKITHNLFLFIQLLVDLLLTLSADNVILLCELLSHLLNLILECFFVFFVFGSESDALVGMLFCELV